MPSENLRNPFIIQCSNCKTILSDSFSLQSMKHDHLIHSYFAIEEPSPENQYLSKISPFENCVLNDIYCVCGNYIGKKLISSSAEWNGFAGMFAFEKNAIISYVLGGSSYNEITLSELYEDVEKLKCVITKIYKKVYQ